MIPLSNWEKLKGAQLWYDFMFILCSPAYFQDHSQTFMESKRARHSEDGRIFPHLSWWQYYLSNLQIYQKSWILLNHRSHRTLPYFASEITAAVGVGGQWAPLVTWQQPRLLPPRVSASVNILLPPQFYQVTVIGGAGLTALWTQEQLWAWGVDGGSKYFK